MKLNFNTSMCIDRHTGEILAVYIRIRGGKVAQVVEIGDGAAFVNYGKKGELLGIEMLQPCKLSVLDNIAKQDKAEGPRVREFIRNSVPRKMVSMAG